MTVEAGARAVAGLRLGAGIGWRPEIADAVERMDVDWVEAVAENVCPGHVPESLLRLRARGVTVVPHGVGLGLGGAERPDPGRLAALAERAEVLGSPLVTEHIAFVRAGALEAGHLLPVPRTREGLAVLCENIRIARDSLPVPLAVENIAALFTWPDEELTEGQFLYELVERTGVRLLIDVANLYTNQVNSGEDAVRALDELPLEALAYVHVAGGVLREGVWHDTHAHPVPPQVLALLGELCARAEPPGVLLERDDDFPPAGELEGELRAIRETVRGSAAAVRGNVVVPPAGGAAVPVAARTRLAEEQYALLAAPAALATIALALSVRALWPATDFAKYAGDALYTVLLACLCLLLAPALAARRAAAVALALSWAVEVVQLWPYVAGLSARHTLARYAIGSTFNAPDLLWYAVGAALSAAVLAPLTGRAPAREPR
ncbi:DUF692 family multinuclear iron-containing protein [Streptomyces sp. NEAU-H3]|uniref:multinuclear nonheme iron-dependent oxidase n=1 Tax=Streptomyces sp. NEAU-H3 TaxID=2720636 RepID=UPI001438EE93|nr:DUF692 family multinuclear iron-containing protein [Streptomyces sp. NEAU-H3]NJA60095.1 DUF692 family protein [Streptomyces sp. NEAU-H3]